MYTTTELYGELNTTQIEIANITHYLLTNHIDVPPRVSFEIDIDFFNEGEAKTTLEDLINKVGGVSHKDVVFELEYGSLSLFITRQETDEEYLERISEIKDEHVKEKNERREQYLRLKEEFESEEV